MKKKLLILPLTFVLSSTPILVISACSNTWEAKGNDGTQILIKLPGLKFNKLTNFQSNNLSEITIKNLLDNFLNNAEIQKEIFTEVTKRLQLAVIKTNKDKEYWKKDYKRLMDDINSYFENDWKIAQGTNWKKQLTKEIETWGSEETFKEHLLLDMNIPANVYTRMRTKFIDNFQTSYKKYTPSNILTFATELITKMTQAKDNSFNINNWFFNETATKIRNVALMEAYNYKDTNELKDKIQTEFKTKPITNDALYIYDENNKVQLDDINTKANKLSLEQKFIAEQWYNNLKPLHVSQITFKYDGKDKNGLEDGIEEKDFEEKNGNGDKINKFLTETGKSFEKLAQIYSDDNKDTFGEMPKLLTLNSSNDEFSAMFKAAAYNLAFDKTTEATLPNNYKDLIKELSRGSNEKTHITFKYFKVGNDKVVAFADTNEIRFVKINGLDKLKEGFINTSNDVEKPQGIHDIVPAIASKDNLRLEQTPYLKYIIDYYKDNTHKKNIFNPIEDIKTYTSFTSNNIESNNNWWFWFWDMMAWQPWNKDNKTPKLDWYKDYMTFEGEIGKKWQLAIDKMFRSYTDSRSLTKINELIIKLQEENAAIKKIKDSTGDQVNLEIDIEHLKKQFLDSTNNQWHIKNNNASTTNKVLFSNDYVKWWKNNEGDN